ncbi:hypothetical protein EJB05_23044, partial [Eragrostis curvula]
MPTKTSHVQTAVLCGRLHVHSGGHDYEGISYRATRPEEFAVVDLTTGRGSTPAPRKSSPGSTAPKGRQASHIAAVTCCTRTRTGVPFNIQYVVWSGSDGTMQMNSINGLYKIMEPFVCKNPRSVYVNYLDLDHGQNAVVRGVLSFDSGKVGDRYLGAANFKRLAITKAKVDPGDFFRNEQTILPITYRVLKLGRSLM